MLLIAGGPERYFSAVREYWLFHTSTFAVWNVGIGSRGYFLLAFLGNTSYEIGIGMIFLFFGLYAFCRTSDWRLVSTKKILFFVLWLVPAFLFHIFVFMNPDQAGYSVFFLPALFADPGGSSRSCPAFRRSRRTGRTVPAPGAGGCARRAGGAGTGSPAPGPSSCRA